MNENYIAKINKILEYKILLINLRKEIIIPKKMVYKKNNYITLDDIFHCDERNRWVYDDDLDVYPTLIGRPQLEKYKKIFKKINKVSVKTNLNRKNYILVGEKCPICCEAIVTKKQAFLTDCSHSFHYNCIKMYYNLNYIKFAECPICRQDIGDFENLKRQYYQGPSTSNKMDRYENFWNDISTLIPEKCYWRNFHNVITNIHNFGMNKNCNNCLRYRKGEI
jgi:hypothetical protein